MTDWKDFKGAAKRIEDIDLPRIGFRIGVGEDEIHAFMDVEAAGSGFDHDGRPKILFEPHVFYRNLAGAQRDAAVAAGLAYKRWGTKPYPKDSYPRLIEAMKIDETAALKAASWGLGQILGENFHQVGYDTPQAMVLAFMDDEEHHLEAMVQFLIANHIDDDLRRHAWPVVARVYNGAGKYIEYARQLAMAFARWAKIRDTPWTRPVGVAAGIPEFPAMTATPPAPPAPSPFGDLIHLLGSTGLNVLMQSNPATAIIGNLVKNALDKPNVPIEVKDVPAAAAEVLSAIKADPKVALVATKPASQSKINWLNSGFATAVAGYVGFNIPTTPEGWAAAIGAFLVPLLTVVLKTWFTTTVTPASIGK